MLLIVKKRAVLISSAVLCCCVLAFLYFYSGSAQADSAEGLSAVKRVNIDTKKIALIVDSDDAGKLVQISERLNAKGIPAAYCVSANTSKEVLSQLQNNGGMVLNHSNTHINMTKLSAEQIELELDAAKDALDSNNINHNSIFFPPFAGYTQEMLNACYDRNLLPVLYDVDISQWCNEKEASIAKQVLKKCKNGSIIYADMDKLTQDKLMYAINEIKKKKWDIISLDGLLYKDNYSIDKNGVQNTK